MSQVDTESVEFFTQLLIKEEYKDNKSANNREYIGIYP